MSTIVERIGNALGRRAFLNKLMLLSGAFVCGVLGVPTTAYAVKKQCCHLCYDPEGGCSYAGCSDEWCWECPFDCTWYRCFECFKTGTGYACPDTILNTPKCTSAIKCSKFEKVGPVLGCDPK